MPHVDLDPREWVERLHLQITSRQTEIRRAKEYYLGRQPLKFASQKWREYHAERYQHFSDNWCGIVANSPVERLKIIGFRLDESPTQSSTEKNLWQDWQANELDAQSSQGFLESIIARRSYALVWGSEEDEPEVTWESPAEVTVAYDPANRRKRLAALKTWTDDDVEYATLYLPDEVYKYWRPGAAGRASFVNPLDLPRVATGAGGWQPREVSGESWPIPNPLGLVPVVEYPNRPLLGGEPQSDIHGTMAMQDAINLLWAYLFNAADHASFPTRVVMGQEPPKLPILDTSGNVVGEKAISLEELSEERLLWLTGENTKIDSWNPANLEVFTNITETAVTHVAAQTRTPPHYLVLGKGMININAEGMRTAETGLAMKSKENQTFFTPPTREIFAMMALVRGNRRVAKKARQGTVQWADVENRGEAQQVDALAKLYQIGFPFQWIAERYGLAPAEITRLSSLRAEDMRLRAELTGSANGGPESGQAGATS